MVAVKFTLVSSVIALLVSQANAFTLQTREDASMNLVARQLSSLDPSQIPSQCKSQCSSIVSTLSDTSCQASTSCLCTESNNKNLANCFDCLLPLINDQSEQTLAQSSLKNFEDQCNAAGFSLSSITVTPGKTSGAGQLSVNARSGLALSAAAAGSLFIFGM
ncbi:hypothetical protein C8Q75DRAFT_802943 [Abortiporus biennis]|nr:hypothetical protein C8Q75DRAFT_802943 [Abortiporus biennis]